MAARKQEVVGRGASLVTVLSLASVAAACARDGTSSTTTTTSATEPDCQLVANGFGPAGTVSVKADVVAENLEVPWSIAFLPNGDALVTERAGSVRLIRGGSLVPEPVVRVPAVQQSESGLLGLAIDPRFAESRAFFVYYTAAASGGTVNRVARYLLDPSGLSAQEERTILDGIPAGALHDGGRLRVGPDGMLYVGTGDARVPESSQDPSSPAGKLLRLSLDGSVPPSNPSPGQPAFVLGLRNLQAFDWLADGRLVIADHGPSGELGRSGHDEISVARAGDNLGWPSTWRCETQPGQIAPVLVWARAAPPGGGLYYRGDAIPGWKNSFLVGTLASRHLHRIVLDAGGRTVAQHEVYFEGDPPGGLGRLRDVVAGPDGAVYVTTSNCDGRGTCPTGKDKVLRISQR
jgi:aldose sugar dehydrogenase